MSVILIHLSLIDDNPFQKRAEYGDIAELGRQIAEAHSQYPATRGLMQTPRGRLVADDAGLIPHESFLETLEEEGGGGCVCGRGGAGAAVAVCAGV